MTIAAGTVIHTLALNLSLMLQPWVRVAAMVVSEMNDRSVSYTHLDVYKRQSLVREFISMRFQEEAAPVEL